LEIRSPVADGAVAWPHAISHMHIPEINNNRIGCTLLLPVGRNDDERLRELGHVYRRTQSEF
jgi:hypothetical protein